MDENKGPWQRGRTNPFWLLAGGYLLYLAFQLFQSLWKGEASNPLVNVGGGVVFVGVGCWLFWREWKAYRYAMDHKDDPSTWSDQPLADAEPEGLDAPEDGEEEKP